MWLPAEHELLLRIIEEPDDLSLRGVLADLLNDRGEPLGELIAIQCRLENIRARKAFGPWHALETRAHELLDAHEARWHQQAAPFAQELEFRRGLPEVLHTTQEALIEDGGLTVAAPILELSIPALWGSETGGLFTLPLLSRVRRLAVTSTFPDTFKDIPALPRNIRALRISPLHWSWLQRVSQRGWFENLEQLELGVEALTPEALVLFEGAPRLARLSLVTHAWWTQDIWFPALERLLAMRPDLVLEWRGVQYDGAGLAALQAAQKTPISINIMPVERERFGDDEVVGAVERKSPSGLTLERLADGSLLARSENKLFRADVQLQLSLPPHPSRLNARASSQEGQAVRYEPWPAFSLQEVGVPLAPPLALYVAAAIAEATASLSAELARRVAQIPRPAHEGVVVLQNRDTFKKWPLALSRDDVWLSLEGDVKLMPQCLYLLSEDERRQPGEHDRHELGAPPFLDDQRPQAGPVFTAGTVLLELLKGEAVIPLRGARAGAEREHGIIVRALEQLASRPLLPSMLDEALADFDALVERALTKVRAQRFDSLLDFAAAVRAHPRCGTREQLAQHVRLKQSRPR